MTEQTHEITVQGVPHALGAEAIAGERWGSGFARRIGIMQVFRLHSGGFVAHHKDTGAGRDVAMKVDALAELAGFFGFCPRAISVYEELGIPARAVSNSRKL